MIRLKKILNKWFTRAILICFFVLVGIGGMCENPYQTNPNLKLLVGDTTTDYDSIHCSNPVVSPDGNIIYYLRVSADSVNSECGIGSIFSITAEGKDNRQLLNGKFTRLSISHNGKMLAVCSNRGSFNNPEPESLILVVHLDNVAMSSIDSFWITPKWVSKIEWAYGDGDLYYMEYSKVYRLNLLTGNEEIFTTPGIAGFDLYGDNSIYLDSIMEYLQINPAQETYAIGIRYYDEGSEFLLRNIVANKIDTLPYSLIPYCWGQVGYPYWFPGGGDIVFMAKPYTEPAGRGSGEVWILENVFEQIEE